MDGENNGKPENPSKMDDLGGKPTIFGNILMILIFSDVFLGSLWTYSIPSQIWLVYGFHMDVSPATAVGFDNTWFWWFWCYDFGWGWDECHQHALELFGPEPGGGI